MTGAIAAALTLSFLLASAAGQEWRVASSTYYGGPPSLGESFDAARGQGSFGILAYGACGYTNSDGSLVFPQETYAASADANYDYAGSCGRCYEVQCVDGLVLEAPDTPVDISTIAYLPSIDPTFKDTLGRSWLGNPSEDNGTLYSICWKPKKTLRIRIADSCPCTQVLQAGAPGVKPGGETRTQQWCCGGIYHFDISYWGFEQLAHPLYGAIMLKYRPVDCVSGSALPFSPGYVSKTIYNGLPQPGWAIFPDQAKSYNLKTPGIAPDGSNGICISLSHGGILSFRCRECYETDYQPFKDASSVQFYIKSNSNSSSPFDSSTPKGQLPGLKMFVLKEETKEYCGQEPVLGEDGSATKQGNWFKVNIPFSLFKCGNGSIAADQITNIAFQNTNIRDAEFCLANFKIKTN